MTSPPPSASSASPWPSATERRQNREAKSEAVLRAAVRLFNERGFSGASLDDVAAQLNVTKPVIYRYFSNKDHILFECVRMGLTQILEASAGAAAQPGSAYDRLMALVRRYARIMTEDFGICVIRTGDHELAPDSRAKFRELKREIGLAIRALIVEGMEDGSIAPCDPRLTSFAIAGALNWIAKWYDPAGPASAEEIGDHFATLIARMLRPPAEPAGA